MILDVFKPLKYYKSIDEMPVYNWFKIQETNDITFALIKKKSITKREFRVLEQALQTITNQYIDTFGISEHYKHILRLQGELKCLEIDLICTNERKYNTFINIKKAELKKALETANKGETTSVKVHAEKYMGRKIDMRTTSVREFYEILKEMQKEYSKPQNNE